MRVVSQDGRIDIPYDNFVLKIIGNKIVAYSANDLDGYETITLATYVSGKDLLRGMRELRKAYNNGAKVFKFEYEGQDYFDKVLLNDEYWENYSK